MTKLYITILLFVLSVTTFGQTIEKGYFRSPIDFPIFLAGNFAELRPNHFHGGLDIKTEGVEGKKIYATADGYISRIKISHGGYGKVIYMNHPNGYTTAYAHLQKFNPEIEKFVQKAQYYKESYTIEVFPGKNQLKYKKGDVIAFSGNSGGSGGPHLHYEIRVTKSEHTVNPLMWGFDIKDNVKPTIKNIGLYPISTDAHVDGQTADRFLGVTGAKGNYRLKKKEPIKAYGEIGIGVETLDFLNGSSNKCGVYSIELFVDSQLVYCHSLDEVGFDETRYINSLVDFHQAKRHRRKIQRSFVEPNNRLRIYCKKDLYSVKITDDKIHDVKYVIKDGYQNTSTIAFQLKGTKKDLAPAKKDSTTIHFDCKKTNRFENEMISAIFPPNVLYNDLDFKYKLTDTIKNAIAPTHHLQTVYTPLQAKIKLKIKVDKPAADPSKMVIVALNAKKQFMASEGGTYKDGWMSVGTRSLGAYTVMVDSIKPRIKPHNIFNGKAMKINSAIQVKIYDDLSGIKSYKGYIDGEWVLMEYDYKKNMLQYFFDDSKIKPGEHTFKLIVTDRRANKAEYVAKFTR